MRILILAPEFSGSGGGITTFYRSLVPELCAAGVEVRVIEGSGVHAWENRSVRKESGVLVETLEHSRLARWEQKFSGFAALPGLRRYLAAAWAMWEQADYGLDADIVEATDWGLLFVPPAIEATRPLVVQCHGSIGQIADHDPIAADATENLFVRLIERDVLSTVSMVQTYSKANAAFWQTQTGRSVQMIPPAWSPINISEPLEHNDRGLVVGRLQRWKGPVVLCEALNRMGHAAPGIDWVGRDTAWGARSDSTAKHLAETYPDVWPAKLIHHGPVLPAEVASRQARALFNVVPSTWDMFNFTVVEAMASGRPTIVSTGAGASDLIEDGVNGYLFANEDSDALAGAIQRVMSEKPSRLTNIGREAQRTIRTALNEKTIVSRRVAGYRGAIDTFNTRKPPSVSGWLGAVCRPSEASENDMAFLENLPLRALSKHVVTRISRSVRSK